MRKIAITLACFMVGLSGYSQQPVRSEEYFNDDVHVTSLNNTKSLIYKQRDIYLENKYKQIKAEKFAKLKQDDLRAQRDTRRYNDENILWQQKEQELSLREKEYRKIKSDVFRSSKGIKGDNSFVSESDSLALVALYNTTDGDNWTNNTNWLTGPVYSWFGITISNSRVVGIDFWNSGSGNNLTGTIPAEIGDLSALTFLSFTINQLTGEIPSELYNLTNLTYLDLDNNKLTGSISVDISKLSNLQVLYAGNNQFIGSIPAEFGSLSNLTILRLWNNQLTGTIPVELGNLLNLTSLSLGYNQLTGSIPSELGNLMNLQGLYLDNNDLSGSIPSELGNLSSLQELYLDHNELSGSIPAELGTLTNLTFLKLRNNQLTGLIPADIFNLTNLTYLDLDNNKLTGSISVDISKLSNLQVLYAGNNQFIGSLPAEFGSLSNLTILRLWNNQLTGAIPFELGNLLNLTSLSLGYNQLTGSIPSELGNLMNLQGLYLDNNDLSGSIPSELGNLVSLQQLYLDHNELSGSIPSELGNLSNLTILSLWENQLSGEIPTELGNLTNLTNLGLNYNQLTDLPDLSALINLNDLYLNDNVFTFGDLENTGLNFSSISTVDYAPQARLPEPNQVDHGDNTTTLTVTTDGVGNTYQWYKNGEIVAGETSNTITVDNTEECYYYCEVSNPNYPDLQLETEYAVFNISMSHGVLEEEYNALVALYNSTDGDNWNNNTNWLSEEYVENWYGIITSKGRVTQVNLSNNQLSGSIPSELGNLLFLYLLDLTSNQLTDSIPSELGNLTSLNALLLYNNKITGTIPANLGNLTSLKQLWLHSNQLSGTIPVELGNLTNLIHLTLSNNQLSGSIPVELGNLSNLTYLWLGSNQLTGLIPAELGNLSNLLDLNLHINVLTGSIPPELGNLTNIFNLSLSYNNLTGSIPSELGNLMNLQGLYLDNNDLSGSIPSELGNLSNLTILSLWENKLSGEIPPELGNLTNLTSLWLNYNQLTDLPDLSALINLNDLYLNDNVFTFGDLENTGLNFSSISTVDYAPQARLPEPTQVDHGDNTTTLTVTTDGVGNTYQWYKNGEIVAGETSNSITVDNTEECYYYCEVSNPNYPDLQLETEYAVFNMSMSHGVLEEEYNALVALFNSTDGNNWTNNTNWLSDKDVDEWYGIEVNDIFVVSIILQPNNLIGTIPSDLGNLSNLLTLRLSGNQLSGTIPLELGDLANLETLNLGLNELSGPIPSEIGNLINLNFLYLAYNELTGTIPSELGNLINLEELVLRGNNLTGTIPPEIGNLTNLYNLSLSYNNLTGSIPSELGNLSNLTSIDIVDNQLTGTIPSELGNLSNLGSLWLYNNQLSGEIPAELGNLSNLGGLYLRYNNLSGTIPAELGNLINISSIDLAGNQLTGSLPAEFNNLINLDYFHISENLLTGLTDLTATNLNASPPFGGSFLLDSNAFTFSDLDQTELNFSEIDYLRYAPQDTLELTFQDSIVNKEAAFTFNFQDLTVEALTSTDNLYALYKDDVLLQSWSSNMEYTIASFSAANEGKYTIRVSNPNYPDLTLVSDTLTLSLFVNHAPTDITLSSSEIDENQSSGSTVGQLSVIDQDTGDTHTFVLIAGDGNNDAGNSSFTIEGNTLKTADVFDYEAQSTYNIYLEVEDAEGAKFQKSFIIDILDENEIITGLELSNYTIQENQTSGSTVGELIAIDEDLHDTYTYNVEGSATFVIDGNQLKTSQVLDYETEQSYSLKIKVEDAAGNSYQSYFEIAVLNTNDNPTDISLSNSSINENQPAGTDVGLLTTADQDKYDNHEYILISGNGTNDADNNSFYIEGNILKTNEIFDYETKPEKMIYIQTIDLEGGTYEKAFTIQVNDLTGTGIENVSQEYILVYPNPAKDYLIISTGKVEKLKDYLIYIIDVSGNTVFETKVSDPLYEINLSTWNGEGLYLMYLYDDSGELIHVKKIILQ